MKFGKLPDYGRVTVKKIDGNTTETTNITSHKSHPTFVETIYEERVLIIKPTDIDVLLQEMHHQEYSNYGVRTEYNPVSKRLYAIKTWSVREPKSKA